MSAANVAIRLARREVVRRPWRSLMVMLLVIVPVVVLTGLAVMVRTHDRTLDQEFTARWGEADIMAVGDQSLDGPTATALAHLDLPADAGSLNFREITVRIKTTDAQREWVALSDLAVADPIVSSTTEPIDGRAPDGPDEVLLSDRLADALGLEVGDTLAIESPVEMTATVVGTTTWHDDLGRQAIVIDGEAGGPLVDQFARGAITRQLVDLGPRVAPSPELLDQLAFSGTANRFVQSSDWSGEAQVVIVWSWVGGAVAFVIVGVVIAAAFAVTARRQLRLIGQLMGNGASEATLRATLFLQGSVIGFAGAVVGIALTLAGLVVYQPLVERIVGRRIPAYDVSFGDLVPIVVLATIAATVAALIPARTAVRTSVLQALAGRRPVGPYPNKLVTRGALAAAAGLVLLAVATAGAVNGATAGTWLFVLTGIAGAVAVILGTCAMSPAIISRLEPLAGHLRGTSRLAARSVARQRTRTGAIVAAVAVVAAGAVAGSTAWMSAVEAEVSSSGWTMPEDLVALDSNRFTFDDTSSETVQLAVDQAVLAEVLEIVPGSTVVRGRSAYLPASGPPASGDGIGPWDAGLVAWSPMTVVDDRTAELMGLAEPVRDGLRETGLVTYGWDSSGNAIEGIQERPLVIGDTRGEPTTLEARATVVPDDLMTTFGTLISEEAAVDLGLEIGPGSTFVSTPSDLTDDQRDALSDLREDLWAEPGLVPPPDSSTGPIEPSVTESVNLSFEDPSWQPSRALVTAVIIAVATAFSLGVVALGLALSAAETKDERDVLAAIGARPRTLARLAAAKAAVLSSVGTVVGVPLGFVPTFVVVRAAEIGAYDPMDVVFPWVQVALLVIAVPVVATAATLVASGIGLRTRPVQASSMAFD